MANLLFLDVNQVMRILLGEMPDGVYATDLADNPDPDFRSYSSSEIRTVAQMMANLYENLQDIWQNKFISTVQADEIGRWEMQLFPYPVDSTIPFDIRKQNLLTKARATGGLSYTYFMGILHSILDPVGLPFMLGVYCGMPTGAWILELSHLDLDTYLAGANPIIGAIVGRYNLDCYAQIITSGTTVNTSFIVSGIPSEVITNIYVGAGLTGVGIPSGALVVSKGSNSVTLNVAATASNANESIRILNYIAAGLTAEDLANIQETAYTFAVYIYGNASAQTISDLEQTLTVLRPAGTTFQIFNDAIPPYIDPEILDLGGGEDCVLVDSYDCGNGAIGATYNVWDFSL